MPTTFYRATQDYGETIDTMAHWGEASAPVFFRFSDGSRDWVNLGDQVADFRHSPRRAIASRMDDDEAEEGFEIEELAEATDEELAELRETAARVGREAADATEYIDSEWGDAEPDWSDVDERIWVDERCTEIAEEAAEEAFDQRMAEYRWAQEAPAAA